MTTQTITIGTTDYTLTTEQINGTDGKPFEMVTLTGKRGAVFVGDADATGTMFHFTSFSGTCRDLTDRKSGKPVRLRRTGNSFAVALEFTVFLKISADTARFVRVEAADHAEAIAKAKARGGDYPVSMVE